MTMVLTRRLAVFALLAVFAFSLGGCWNPFAPPGDDPQDHEPEDYRIRTTPENVIHNIEVSYEYKNPMEYLDCLSEDFIFYPDERDVQDPELNIPPEWYKVNETDIHTNMFDDGSDVESISLTLTNATTEWIEGIPGDPSDDFYIYRENVDLRVNVVGGLTYLATTPSEYHFRVDQDQLGPNDETLWEIYLWYDLGEERRSDGSSEPGVVHVSLAELKSMFQ